MRRGVIAAALIAVLATTFADAQYVRNSFLESVFSIFDRTSGAKFQVDVQGASSSTYTLSTPSSGTSSTLPTSGTILSTDNVIASVTNKTIDAEATGNVFTNWKDANIKVGANIARSKLASGTANHVLINDGSGVMSSEAVLTESRGGTDQSTYTTGDMIYSGSTNNLNKLSVGGDGSFLTAAGGIPTWEYPNRPSCYMTFTEDWTCPGLGGACWTWNNTSAGTNLSFGTGDTEDRSKHPGIALIDQNAATSSFITRMGSIQYTPGNGELFVEWVIKIETLSDATTNYTMRVGFGSTTTATADNAYGLYFEYASTTSANWLIKSADNSVRTTTTTSTAVTAGYHRLGVKANDTATSVEYFVDGVSVGTITSNIPTTTQETAGLFFQVFKNSGATSRFFRLDYAYLFKRFTTCR
ncbi:MAG TPA: hypothetical protein VMZ26_17500 [Pyrinomonadaceae bacterium]|nr:hypothetical protein [Pyrinomonadaceae bacterium]